MNTAVYVINRTGRSSVKGKTPYKLWLNKRIDLNSFKVFGSKVHVHIPKEKRRKWDPKSKEGIFVGYEDNTKGYRVYFPSTGKVEIARNIVLYEKQLLNTCHV